MNSRQLMETIGIGLGADLNRILALRVKDVAGKDSICMPIGKRGIQKTYRFPGEVKQGIEELIQGKSADNLLFEGSSYEKLSEDYFLQKMIQKYEAETGDKEYGRFLLAE